MALPLPRVIPDMQAGGGIVTAMRGINALSNDLLENRIKNIQAQYAPVTIPAKAASEMAYANLVGPQFLAKLMGNTDILANLPDDRKKQALEMLYRAGSGQGTGNAMASSIPEAKPSNSLLGFVVDKIKNAFSENKSPQQQNALLSSPMLSANDKNAINGLEPGESYIVQGNPASQSASVPTKSFPENVANYKGIVQEGEELGKIRAKDIENLNDTVFSGETNQATLDNVSNILGSQAFEQIRQLPALGNHELSYYAKFGTPEQQNMIGQYYTLTGNIIKDSARDFPGAFRKGEQQLLQGMKPAPSDTVDTARGKVESLALMNKLLVERSRLTSQLMTKYHYNKLEAQEIADKQISGNDIRKQIHERLNPNVTIRNRKTGEVITVPLSEARKRGVANV